MVFRRISRTRVLDKRIRHLRFIDETPCADRCHARIVLRGDDQDFVDEFLDERARVKGDCGGAVGPQVDASFAAASGQDLIDGRDGNEPAPVSDLVDAMQRRAVTDRRQSGDIPNLVLHAALEFWHVKGLQISLGVADEIDIARARFREDLVDECSNDGGSFFDVLQAADAEYCGCSP